MDNSQGILTKFYKAFARHDAAAMVQCYHPDIEFDDPVFGKLKGEEAAAMWKMLIERSNGKLQIDFTIISDNGTTGSAKWVATYVFSKTGRNVVNHITANFKMRDGLIIGHSDNFNLWMWSRQAFGIKGWIFGWTGFMQKKIQKQAKKALANYKMNIR